ncbi:MAG: hypothetical protein ACLURW_15435 [Flavonifractor plautii]
MPCGSGGAGRAAAAGGAAGGLRERLCPGLRLAGPGGAGRRGDRRRAVHRRGGHHPGGDGAARAAALRLQAETVLGPWLADRGCFQGVPG